MKMRNFFASMLLCALLFAGCTSTPTTAPSQETPSAVEKNTKASITVGDGDEENVAEAVYQDYSVSERDAVHGKKAYALFFHASWCPTCRVMEKNILADLDSFPEGTNILKADFDSEKELRGELEVKIQSTIVIFDAAGNVVWNGQDPSMDDLKKYLQNSLG